jgi:hypothetical protein
MWKNRWNWSHKPHTTEMQRVRPAIEAGLMRPAEAVALYMRPVLNVLRQTCLANRFSAKRFSSGILSSFHHLPKVTSPHKTRLTSQESWQFYPLNLLF